MMKKFTVNLITFLLESLIAYWAWNATLPDLFHFPIINFYQVMLLKVLINSVLPNPVIHKEKAEK